MNLARLNQVLIASKPLRERLRRARWMRLVRLFSALYRSTTYEGKVGAILLLLVGAVGLQLGNQDVYVVWAALTGLFTASILVRGLYALEGVRLQVRAPQRVTVGDEVVLDIWLENNGPRTHANVRIAGPLLSWDGTWTRRLPVIPLIRPGERVRIRCGVRFFDRGHHFIEPFRAGALLPLGLMLGRLVHSNEVRVTVVPTIARVAALPRPELVKYQPGGIRLASLKGESLELMGVRPYRCGDPVRFLHAKTWARTGRPAVREYQQEYFTRTALVVDTDASKQDAPLLEATLSLAAGLVDYLGRADAVIDVLVTGADVHELTVGRSLGHVDQALDLLSCVKCGSPLNGPHVLQRLAGHFPRLTAVYVVVLRWDAQRRQLVQRLQSVGVHCHVLVVQPNAPLAVRHDASATWVSMGAIQRREVLAL